MINCYRLKLTDSLGNSTYSRTLVIHVPKTGDVSMISATPDLSVNDIDVDIDMKEPAMVNMTITDKEGNNILRQTVKVAQVSTSSPLKVHTPSNQAITS